MARKEKSDYTGKPEDNLYVVWVDGKYRVYKSLSQANSRYLEASEQGKPTQFIRYEISEIVAEANIRRQRAAESGKK